MPRPSTAVAGLSLFLIVGLIAGFFFLRHLVKKSFPQTEGTLRVAGLHQPVDVVRDSYGVPHIRASDEHDLMLATGYVHAQDRLWQMDLLRRAGEGRLSEILGQPTVAIDRLFRTLDLSRTAGRIVENLHPESKRILTDYAEGVNAFIDSHKGSYPVEFDMLNYQPDPWTPEHSILISRLLAWELNLAWWTDITYGEIGARVGPARLKEIIPAYPDSIPATVSGGAMKKAMADLRPMLDAARSYRSAFGLGSLEAGSNAWVVDSSKSLSGKPILASDPHLAMPAPSRWYELHLTAPGWNVAGVTLPGVPVVVIGHTPHHAWGLTNAMIDDADFYLEKPDSLNPANYRFEKSSLPFEEHEEIIRVRGADSVVVMARATRHGPIVSDVHPAFSHPRGTDIPVGQPRGTDIPVGQSRGIGDSLHPLIAMRWTGFEVSDEVYGFYLMDKAGSPSAFEEGVKEITVPGQAVVYGDTNNTIAFWTAGKIPVRGKQPAMLPMEGWTGENEWKGFIPFAQLPKVMNPREGFIATANEKLGDKNFPHYISTLWEPQSRILRIRELLRTSEKLSADDFRQFQQDVYSPYAKDVAGHIIAAYRDTVPGDPRVTDALNYLRNWDYRFTQADIATSIFNAFFVRLLSNTFEDEMGEDVFHDFVFFGAIPYRVTEQLLASDTSSWFDDIRTPRLETKNEILRRSLEEGLKMLRDTLGAEMKTWRWGELHTVTFRHPFGSRKPLGSVFNIGPFPVSGGGTTVDKSEYKFSAPFTVAVGASMRQVVDLADPVHGSIVITSGESGQPLNTHYDDQTPLWLNGGYIEMSLDWDELLHSPFSHLILESR